MENIRPDLKDSNSCCSIGSYNGKNLVDANPFDTRQTKLPNPWGKNELIMQDKSLRCAARIQPLDSSMDVAMKLAREDMIKKGLPF